MVRPSRSHHTDLHLYGLGRSPARAWANNTEVLSVSSDPIMTAPVCIDSPSFFFVLQSVVYTYFERRKNVDGLFQLSPLRNGVLNFE